MKAIISLRKPGKWDAFLSSFGYAGIRQKKYEQAPQVLHLFLPQEHPREQKVLQKVKKILNKHGIKDILPERTVHNTYADCLLETFAGCDGRKVMLDCLQEELIPLLQRYGFQKGKVRVFIECEDCLKQIAMLLKKHQQYIQFLVFSGQMTPEKQKIAEMFYLEFGINTVFSEQPERTECNLLILETPHKTSWGKQMKLIINLGKTQLNTSVPVVNDFKLPAPRVLDQLACRRVELKQLLEESVAFGDEKNKQRKVLAEKNT